MDDELPESPLGSNTLIEVEVSRCSSPAHRARCVVAQFPTAQMTVGGPIAGATDDVGYADQKGSYDVQHEEEHHRRRQSPE